MKVLFGVTRADAGTIRFRGRPLEARSPADALAAGRRHDPPAFHAGGGDDACTENVMLWAGASAGLRAEAPKRVARAHPSRSSQRFGLDLDPDARVADLPLGRRQRVEILKAILRKAESADPRRADIEPGACRSRRSADGAAPAARRGARASCSSPTSCRKCSTSATTSWCCAPGASPAASPTASRQPGRSWPQMMIGRDVIGGAARRRQAPFPE